MASTASDLHASSNDMDALKTVRFDAWKCDANKMIHLLENMYHELGFLRPPLNIREETLRRFLATVHKTYRSNPFHNFRHCFCVTQMMYVFIHNCGLSSIFSQLELCALITACICHDLDHPGLNNAYHINSRSELAMKYNDVSPLENHHWAKCNEILSDPDTNIFNELTPAQREAVHRDIAILILATDMTKHADILEEFKVRSAKFDAKSTEDLTSLKMILIKACDISNEIRPVAVAEPWADMLLQEYFFQSNMEKNLGLPSAPFMDPERITKPSSQVGFIKFVLIPLFEALLKVFPQLESLAMVNLRDALKHYEDLVKKGENNCQNS